MQEVRPKYCLEALTSAAADLDVSAFDPSEVTSALRDVRAAHRCLDGLVVRLGSRSAELAGAGRTGSSEEMLRGDGAVGAKQARREAARAAVVSELPSLGTALSDGVTTGEHVDAVARRLGPLVDSAVSALPLDQIVAKAAELPVETFDRFVKRQVELTTKDHGLADMVARQRASEFRHWFDDRTGMGRFVGALDPERYEIVVNAVEQRTSELSKRSGQPLTATLAASAVVELAAQCNRSESRRPSVVVVVDHDALVHRGHDGSIRQTENGHDLPPETLARLCCDAVIRRVTLDHRGVPINVGRKYRTATDSQWAALKAVHASCAWDACSIPVSWCQAHHIHEWEQGGATDLENLIPLCNQHHHRVHEGRWNITLLPDRSLEIYRPNGSHHVTVSAPMRC